MAVLLWIASVDCSTGFPTWDSCFDMADCVVFGINIDSMDGCLECV